MNWENPIISLKSELQINSQSSGSTRAAAVSGYTLRFTPNKNESNSNANVCNRPVRNVSRLRNMGMIQCRCFSSILK
ncbi:hypothetical protein BCAR13_120065 [Paraburkholderia caribensis]|nr:hypothetical protein BCAR13_120065 [Paraburkholderia caribensis]